MSRYDPVPELHGPRGVNQARLKQEWIVTMIECGLITRILPSQVRGRVNMFAVPEISKQRMRPIRFTKDINEFCGRDTLRPCVIATKAQIVPTVLAGRYMILLDMKAMYDQFPLSEAVGSRMCFRHGEAFYRLTVLPMGQRQAVGVANAAMQRLLDFKKRSNVHHSIIDNVGFFGDTAEDVIHDARIFIARCAAVGATLNEIEDASAATYDQVAALVKSVGTFGGVSMDLLAQTVRITQNSVDKTNASWANRENWTWREYAGHVGLLFWAWRILDIPMASFFEVLRFNSDLGKWVTSRQLPPSIDGVYPKNEAWDEPATVWSSVWPVLERWTSFVVANTARVVLPEQKPDVILMVDASRWGWGYISFDTRSGEVHDHGEAWDEFMERRFGDRLEHSTFTEPRGYLNALKHRARITPEARVFAMVTDSMVTMYSNDRGFNTASFHINECIRQKELYFPPSIYQITNHYVDGPSNQADGLSRGLTNIASEQQRESIRQYADDMLRRYGGVRRGRTDTED